MENSRNEKTQNRKKKRGGFGRKEKKVRSFDRNLSNTGISKVV